MDGEVLSERLEGTALSIDPGEHTFVFQMPAQPPATKRLLIQEAQKERRETITFGAASAASSVGTTSGGAGASDSGADSASQRSSAKRAAGWVVGGAGVAGVGLAVLFGVRSVLYNNKSNSEANTANSGTLSPTDMATFANAAQSDHQSALTNQTAAIVCGAAGGVALGVGLFLLLTSGASSTAPASAATLVLPMWEPGGGGVSWQGTW
jgi:hypothetical protein